MRSDDAFRNFFSPLIRGMRQFTFQERGLCAERNHLEARYIAPSTSTGDLSTILPIATSFRKYTHWAAREHVIDISPKVQTPTGAVRSVKLKPEWTHRDYQDGPAPDVKLTPQILQEIESLMPHFPARPTGPLAPPITKVCWTTFMSNVVMYWYPSLACTLLFRTALGKTDPRSVTLVGRPSFFPGYMDWAQCLYSQSALELLMLILSF